MEVFAASPPRRLALAAVLPRRQRHPSNFAGSGSLNLFAWPATSLKGGSLIGVRFGGIRKPPGRRLKMIHDPPLRDNQAKHERRNIPVDKVLAKRISGQSKQSLRAVLKRSAWAFGATTGVRMISTPSVRKTSSKAALTSCRDREPRNRSGRGSGHTRCDERSKEGHARGGRMSRSTLGSGNGPTSEADRFGFGVYMWLPDISHTAYKEGNA
jgi:hypothetical protein